MTPMRTNDPNSQPACCSRRRTALTLALLIVLLAGAGVWRLSMRTHAGAASGTSLNGPGPQKTESPTTIRVGTFNIHGGEGTDGKRDLGRIAELLRDLEVVGLNEVHGGGDNQAEQLGDLLNMPRLFAPTEMRYGGEYFGNGILCTRPVRSWMRIPLAGIRTKGHRNILLARVAHGETTINVLITHIDRRVDRELQLAAAIELFGALDEPAILMGDMNTRANDPQLVALLATEGVHDALAGFAGPWRAERIDWVFTRGLEAVDGAIVDTVASDHPMVWAELALPAAAQDPPAAPVGAATGGEAALTGVTSSRQ